MSINAEEAPTIADLVTIDRSGDADAVVAVATVVWDGPDRPSLQWMRYDRTFGAEMTDEEIIRVVCEDSRFSRTCARCGEVRRIWEMHSPSICQECAERHLGVVY